MDEAKLILTQPVLPPVPLSQLSGPSSSRQVVNLQPGKTEGLSEDEKQRVAKDFESVLINKLLDEMKNTIGGWGFEEDGPCEQIQGIFWLYLAGEVANSGGFGLWKDIYQLLTKTDRPGATVDLVNERL
jgi:Rod binding domain-containing protein